MKTTLPSATLEIRLMPIEQLKPAPYNPRQRLKTGDSAYRKLEASLREFGLVEPLIWNERTGRVVGGHARLRILRGLGVKEVPVSVVQLEEAREKALNVVLNNQEAQGRFDTAKLAELLGELEDLPEFALTGFNPSTLRSLQMEPDAEDEGEGDNPTGTVIVALEMPTAIYEEIAPKLNDLTAEFDLTSHVKRFG